MSHITLSHYDYSHIKLSYITHFYCDQSDIKSVIDLLRFYEKYDTDLLNVIEFVIVDDGSPIEYEIPKFNLNLRWLKINENIKWNQAGARNLGVVNAKSDKVLITDLDHIFYENTLNFIANHSFLKKNIYKMRRDYIRKTDFKKGNYPSHGNTFIISRGTFLENFGYDEEFAGNYGYEDNFCAEYFAALGFKRKYFSKSKYFYRERDDGNVNRDTSYHSLKRDSSENLKIYLRKIEKLKNFGAEFAHSRMFLNFTWKLAKEQFRESIPQLKRKKFWIF